MFNIMYNNKTPAEFGAWLATIPKLTHSEIIRTRQSLPKRDGVLLCDDTSRGNAKWVAMVHTRNANLADKMRKIRRWLSGTGELIISNTPDSFYEVLQVTLQEDVMKAEDYGRITASFEVYPYEFLTSGDTAITDYSTINNPYDESKPVYEISGTGSGTLTVNGNTLTFTSNTKLIIDTRLWTAKNNSGQDANSDVGGYYDRMYLKHGNNSVSISSGFTLKVIPKWGYVI
jgi:phage-related protein